jgi:uncharacterized protein (TIGR03086 family)
MEPLRVLEIALEQTRQIVARTSPDQYDLPTPCTEWDVRALLNHLLGVLTMFQGLPAGDADMAALAGEHIGANASASYDALAAAVFGAWRAEGVVDNLVRFPGRDLPGEFAARMLAGDVLIHGWDLARATGQDVDWNQELAADVLAWQEEAVRLFGRELRSQIFEPELPVPDDADAMTRLTGFVGRRP